jgi:hypothetical protein
MLENSYLFDWACAVLECEQCAGHDLFDKAVAIEKILTLTCQDPSSSLIEQLSGFISNESSSYFPLVTILTLCLTYYSLLGQDVFTRVKDSDMISLLEKSFSRAITTQVCSFFFFFFNVLFFVISLSFEVYCIWITD